ncbi:pyrophosphatase [Caulobacter flavus]|uniref:Pyrophosphatase n=1 Tax=Caulobacter flavus TaxID=1679497 RepID=A0A2N5D3D4_9CAUL|nr:nucleoside triphosphate pyrophosphohydrolase family protein [Caulobacter flavus]AYV48963.1 pyrophosphatase [Caulobacter flavus]PLR20531.1 pyrophosphatase [Caulobacter flavus]
MDDQYEALSLSAYAAGAARTDRGVDGQSLAFPLLGLFGETGSLLSELKKKQRDKAASRAYADAVADELGDVLWYLASIANRGGISLNAVAAHVVRNDAEWAGVEIPDLTFETLQPHNIPRTGQAQPDFETTLLALADEVGGLVRAHREGEIQHGGATLALPLSRIFKLLLRASREAGMTLESAAIKNLYKTQDRWPDERRYPAAFDEGCDEDEQLPRQMTIDIFEKKVGGYPFVFQRCNELFIGDRLTDNSHEPDDYRFHDVFHFAFVAILSWSPVIRSLLRLKRKSLPKTDETEDGARAILIEEGISTWVFGQAAPLQLFEGMNPGQMPIGILKQVRQFASGYEPQVCPLWLWEEALLQGYAAFRFLKTHRRGRVIVDFNNRQLRIEPLP